MLAACRHAGQAIRVTLSAGLGTTTSRQARRGAPPVLATSGERVRHLAHPAAALAPAASTADEQPAREGLLSELATRRWASGSARFSFDQIVDEILRSGGQVHVGTDSRVGGKALRRAGVAGSKREKGAVSAAVYASVICLHTPGSGELARFYVTKEVCRFYTIDDRIMEEANRSVNLALEIQARAPEAEIIVHSDTNTDARWPSSRFTPTIRSWVVGLGFAFRAKPDAWAASNTADWYTHT